MELPSILSTSRPELCYLSKNTNIVLFRRAYVRIPIFADVFEQGKIGMGMRALRILNAFNPEVDSC